MLPAVQNCRQHFLIYLKTNIKHKHSTLTGNIKLTVILFNGPANVVKSDTVGVFVLLGGLNGIVDDIHILRSRI